MKKKKKPTHFHFQSPPFKKYERERPRSGALRVMKLKAPPVLGTTGAFQFAVRQIFGSSFLSCSLFLHKFFYFFCLLAHSPVFFPKSLLLPLVSRFMSSLICLCSDVSPAVGRLGPIITYWKLVIFQYGNIFHFKWEPAGTLVMGQCICKHESLDKWPPSFPPFPVLIWLLAVGQTLNNS